MCRHEVNLEILDSQQFKYKFASKEHMWQCCQFSEQSASHNITNTQKGNSIFIGVHEKIILTQQPLHNSICRRLKKARTVIVYRDLTIYFQVVVREIERALQFRITNWTTRSHRYTKNYKNIPRQQWYALKGYSNMSQLRLLQRFQTSKHVMNFKLYHCVIT